MPENCSHRDAHACGGAIHSSRNPLVILLLAVVTLLSAGQAPAGEQSAIGVETLKPDFNGGPLMGREPLSLSASPFDLPKTYRAIDMTPLDPHPGDFRPRRPSVVERDSAAAGSGDLPLLHGTSVWQRLADYRAHGRIRLLTLWETGGNSVSLQAGKKGEPSLQWTSRSMNRGGATRGLFDQLLQSGMRGPRPATHPSASDAFQRPGKPPETGPGANK